MSDKKYALDASEIKQLIPSQGSCIATDEITVRGKKVGHMYRAEASDEYDSGWRFMAGDENQDYMDSASNLAVYDLNTLANYDQAIIPFLNEPVGSAFDRNDDTFEKVLKSPLDLDSL
jgi:hypothetical protein